MIDRQSVLRKLPSGLSPKAMFYLDGIRHSAEMAGIGYFRLQHSLTRLALQQVDDESHNEPFSVALLDAWSLVDVVDRFRALWTSLPNVLDITPKIDGVSFHDATKELRRVRNIVHHLTGTADLVLSKQGTALGLLNWCTVLPPNHPRGFGISCSMIPGSLYKKLNIGIYNPIGKKIDVPSGLIVISAGDASAEFSPILERMRIIVAELESALIAFGKEDPEREGQHAGSDFIAKFDIRPVSQSTATTEDDA